jgi:hypothetical protein
MALNLDEDILGIPDELRTILNEPQGTLGGFFVDPTGQGEDLAVLFHG